MFRTGLIALFGMVGLLGGAAAAGADDLPCVSTTFRFIGKNDRVCVSASMTPRSRAWPAT